MSRMYMTDSELSVLHKPASLAESKSACDLNRKNSQYRIKSSHGIQAQNKKGKYMMNTDFAIEIEYSKNEKRALEYQKGVAECLVNAKLIDSVECFLLCVGKGKSKSKKFLIKRG